ncbi:hypothetical protein ACH3XW_30520 [Acanthocheilonema viteae]
MSVTHGDSLFASLGFHTKFQTAVTTSFIMYWLGLIIFLASVVIIFYRFMQYEEKIIQFQMESSNESIRLMHSIRAQMITLKFKRTLALIESTKKMLPSNGTLQEKSEPIETERSPMSTRLLNRQRSIFLPLSAHKKLPLLKSIMAIAPHSKKFPMKSIIDDAQTLPSIAKSLHSEKSKWKMSDEIDKSEKTREGFQ